MPKKYSVEVLEGIENFLKNTIEKFWDKYQRTKLDEDYENYWGATEVLEKFNKFKQKQEEAKQE